ncbi:MAG: DUF6588 family protein [Bacteroidota bacterium]
MKNSTKLLRVFAIFMITLSLSTAITRADDGIKESLQKLAEGVAKEYVGPIGSAFGANLNSGWMYRSPEAKTFGVDLDFGLVVMGAMFKDESKKFDLSTSFTFDNATIDVLTSSLSTLGGFQSAVRNELYGSGLTVNVSGPTVVGAKDDSILVSYTGTPVTVNVPGIGDTTFSLTPTNQVLPVTGVLGDLSMLPLAAPQASIGTVFGTKLILRYLPSIEIDKKIGKFEYFGFGIQHNPFMFIPVPEPPVDVSLGFFTQTMTVGTIFESKATMFGLQASKTFGPGALNVTPYAGFSFEKSEMTITYEYTTEDPTNPSQTITNPIEFKLEGENKTRFTIGLSFKLAILKINAEYNLSKYNTIAAGLGIII